MNLPVEWTIRDSRKNDYLDSKRTRIFETCKYVDTFSLNGNSGC